jgi:siderophore synthetase component
MHPDPTHDSVLPSTPRAEEAAFATELAAAAPGLTSAYADALPPARAAVLGRLWRALLYEPLPGVIARDGHRGRVELRDGRVLSGPPRLPHDLGTPHDDPVVRVGDRAYTHPAALLTAIDLPGAAGLTAELDHSVASLALSLAGAAAAVVPGTGARAPRSLEYFEQSVVDGHPYHPCCRSRPGFSVAEQLAYGPEHRPVVGVDLVAVPAGDCRVAGRWPARLRDGDTLLLPVHPWQSEHVLAGLGHRPTVPSAIPAHPLMSVRTLAPLAGGPHLKTALSMRMTSQIRDISPGSVTDSAPLSALLSDVVGRLSGGLWITRDLAAVSAVVDGAPSADLTALLREPPGIACLRAGEAVLPIAALAARPAGEGPPLIRSLLACAGATDSAADWLAAFTGLLLPPLLRLLAFGVAPPAHGQNLLVVLDEHARPRRFVYRDLADVRISPAALTRHGFTVPPLAARVLDDDPAHLRDMLFGYLVGTTLAVLVSALAEGERDTETRLWAAVAAAARRACDEQPATREGRADHAALFGPELRVKALTLMRLQGTHRGERWAALPNPLTLGW